MFVKNRFAFQHRARVLLGIHNSHDLFQFVFDDANRFQEVGVSFCEEVAEMDFKIRQGFERAEEEGLSNGLVRVFGPGVEFGAVTLDRDDLVCGARWRRTALPMSSQRHGLLRSDPK
jgi:hypothetical protein